MFNFVCLIPVRLYIPPVLHFSSSFSVDSHNVRQSVVPSLTRSTNSSRHTLLHELGLRQKSFVICRTCSLLVVVHTADEAVYRSIAYHTSHTDIHCGTVTSLVECREWPL